MATNCFILKLKEEVDNNSLSRINALNITISKANSAGVPYQFRFDGITNAEIVGNGYFTNSEGSTSYGKTRDVSQEMYSYVQVVEAPVQMIVYDMDTANGYFQLAATSGTRTSDNKYISYNIAECCQNTEQLALLQVGRQSVSSVQGQGNACFGDITNLLVNAREFYCCGCTALHGDISTFIANNATSGNLYTAGFVGTPPSNFTFNTSCLQDKNSLFIIPPAGTNVKGDIKWFGDTRNRTCNDNSNMSNTLEGKIEDLVERLVLQGRTDASDYYYFSIGSPSLKRWSKVTYQNKTLRQWYLDYIDAHPGEESLVYMVFTWDSSTTPATISYEFTTTEPASRSVPLT